MGGTKKRVVWRLFIFSEIFFWYAADNGISAGRFMTIKIPHFSEAECATGVAASPYVHDQLFFGFLLDYDRMTKAWGGKTELDQVHMALMFWIYKRDSSGFIYIQNSW